MDWFVIIGNRHRIECKHSATPKTAEASSKWKILRVSATYLFGFRKPWIDKGGEGAIAKREREKGGEQMKRNMANEASVRQLFSGSEWIDGTQNAPLCVQLFSSESFVLLLHSLSVHCTPCIWAVHSCTAERYCCGTQREISSSFMVVSIAIMSIDIAPSIKPHRNMRS